MVKNITHMNFQNHSWRLPQKTADTRNLGWREGWKKKKKKKRKGFDGEEGRGGEGRGMMKIKFPTEKQTQQMRQLQTREREWWREEVILLDLAPPLPVSVCGV